MKFNDGFRSLTYLIQDMKEKHASASKKDEKFYQWLTWSEKERKDRRLRRDRFNAAIVQNVVLESLKRKRSDLDLEKDTKRKEEGPPKRSKDKGTKTAPKTNSIIKVAARTTYSKVLKKVREKARPLKRRDLLIKISGTSNKRLFTEEVTKVIGMVRRQVMVMRHGA